MKAPTALIADDEPLLRDVLRGLLTVQWPDLRIVAQSRNGLEAIEQFEALRPTICFLDIHMPGLSGIEVAQSIGGRAHLVFVTAFDQYALKAFENGVFDYLVKPIQPQRLAESVGRLRERLQREQSTAHSDTLLHQLAERLKAPAPPLLRWIRAGIGNSVRLIPVEDIDYMKADEKYTLVAWRGDGGRPGEALIRTPLKTLLEQLDPAQFKQVHRSAVVNLASIAHATPIKNEKAELHFKHRPEVLLVSRTFFQIFKAE